MTNKHCTADVQYQSFLFLRLHPAEPNFCLPFVLVPVDRAFNFLMTPPTKTAVFYLTAVGVPVPKREGWRKVTAIQAIGNLCPLSTLYLVIQDEMPGLARQSLNALCPWRVFGTRQIRR